MNERSYWLEASGPFGIEVVGTHGFDLTGVEVGTTYDASYGVGRQLRDLAFPRLPTPSRPEQVDVVRLFETVLTHQRRT